METHSRVKSVIATTDLRDQKTIDHELATRVLGLTLQTRATGVKYWAQPDKPDTCFIRADDWNPCVDTSPHFLPQNQWVLVMERMVELGFVFSIQLGRKLPEDWATKRPQVYEWDHFLVEIERRKPRGDSILVCRSSLAEAVCAAALGAFDHFNLDAPDTPDAPQEKDA